MERRHRAGYERHPVTPGDFHNWEDEQVWGETCFRARAALGSQEERLALLDLLDRES